MSTRAATIKEKLLGLLSVTWSERGKEGSRNQLSQQVAESLKESQRVIVSGVHIINLRDLIAGHGDEEQLLEQAGQIAHKVINDNLLVGERFVHEGPETVVFIFSKQTPTGADLRCAQIADQIARQLGHANNIFKGVAFQRETKEIERDAFFDFDASTSNDATAGDGLPGAAAKSGSQNIASAPADPGWQTIERSARLDIEWGNAPEPGRPSNLSGMEFIFKPVWDVKRKVLSTYRCTPIMQHPERGQLMDYDVLYNELAEEFIPDLDLLALKTTVETLRMLHRRKRRVLMVTPVNFRTLERNDSYMKLRIFGRTLEATEKRDMIFELTGLSDAANERRALDLVSTLNEMGRAVTVPARLARTQFHEFAVRGLNLVHTDVTEFADNEARAFDLLDRFAEAANSSNVQIIALGLDTLSLASAAVAAGFDYISGAAIHSPVTDPEFVLRYNPEHLLEDLLKG